MNSPSPDFNALIEIAESSPSAIFIYSFTDQEILYSNAPCVRLLGLQKGATHQDIASSLLNAIPPADRDYAKQVYSDLMDSASISQAELHLMQPDQTQIMASCTAFLVKGRSAAVVRIDDVTKLRQHHNYLMEFGARKNTVLDTTTHYISGALNLMKNLSAEASRLLSYSDDNKVATYLTLLNRNNERALQTIEDLMNNEHLRSPAIFPRKARIDIIQHVTFVHEEFAQSYPHRQFRFHHPKAPLFVNTDDVKALQVLNNFISNSLKFSSPETPIDITVVNEPDEVVISVRDYGIGIPKSLQPFVFERQSGAGRTGLNGERSYELGLSICRNLVNMLEGRIWFDSKEDDGSTFYFTLPKR